MTEKLYEVIGIVDGLENRRWVVAVYPTEDAATQHTRLANQELERIIGDGSREVSEIRREASQFVFDKDATDEWDLYSMPDVAYIVEEVPLVAHVDEYMERFPIKVG